MKNANEPAFPQSNDEIVQAFMEVEECAPNGLTKREAFAMAAMQGCLAYSYNDSLGNFHNNSTPEGLAKASVEFADALLQELDKQEETA